MKEFRTVSIRMPIETYKKLESIAQKEWRSISKQINLYLEEQIQEEEREEQHEERRKLSANDIGN